MKNNLNSRRTQVLKADYDKPFCVISKIVAAAFLCRERNSYSSLASTHRHLCPDFFRRVTSLLSQNAPGQIEYEKCYERNSLCVAAAFLFWLPKLPRCRRWEITLNVTICCAPKAWKATGIIVNLPIIALPEVVLDPGFYVILATHCTIGMPEIPY
jgi:hypothetical protein